MYRLLTAFTGVSLCLASAVQAAEVTGGTLGLSYSAFTRDTSVNRLGIEGSVEVAFSDALAVQGDLGHQAFNIVGDGATSVGVHGIVHLNANAALGAFYTYEDVPGSNIDVIGVEGSLATGQWEHEGYLGRFDDGTFDGTTFGVSSRYAFGNSMGLTASYDRADQAGADIYRVGLKLDHAVTQDVTLYVEAGSAGARAGGLSGSEAFVGLGGSFAFGQGGGATFKPRNLTRLLPGG